MSKNIIGVFGLICSGKSSFSKILANEMNALYIDADLIGHKALIDNKDNVVKEFGEDILDSNNNIDRKKLGAVVFKNKKKLKKLEELNYTYIETVIQNLIDSTDKDVVIEAALIMRSKIRYMCTSLIYVNAKVSDILKRMQRKRNIPVSQARKILKLQRDVKNKRFNADILVNNMKDYNNLLIVAKKIGRHYGIKSKHRRKRLFY